MLPQEIKLSIQAVVERRGLVFLGVVDLDLREDHARFSRWLEEGRHGEMTYLETSAVLRQSPTAVLPDAKSAVIVGLPYQPDAKTSGPKTAGYALYRDYHKVLRKQGAALAAEMAAAYPEAQWRAVADSAPLLERALAAKGQRGFIGKNTCYIHETEGSYLLLGEILTDQKIESEEKLSEKVDGCQSCTLCQVECPTGALATDYQIDSRLCLSYWTIENRGTIPERFWPWLGEYWFGCDICQVACPYNRGEKTSPRVLGFDRVSVPDLFEVAVMDQAAYLKHFSGTPMTRAKREGLKRNALIALHVTKHPRYEEALARVEAEETSYPLPDTCRQLRGASLG